MNRTKKAISEVFWELLEEKPYNKITVQNIVECCQVNRNTFYYHFRDIPDLAEYSIKEWTDQVIKNNCRFGSPINCIIPIAQEFVKRKRAFIHIYHSSCGEALIRYLNEVSFHIVRSYIDRATDSVPVSKEDKEVFVRYYKCTFAGIVLDWLAADVSYDLIDFCRRICYVFEGSGKEAFQRLITPQVS